MIAKKMVLILSVFAAFLSVSLASAGNLGITDPLDTVVIPITTTTVTNTSTTISSNLATSTTSTQSMMVSTSSTAPKTSCSTDSDCGWCGMSCGLGNRNQICAAVMPPAGYVCGCSSGSCASKRLEANITPINNGTTTIPYNGTITYSTTINYNGAIQKTSVQYNTTLSNSTASYNINITRAQSYSSNASIVATGNYTVINRSITLVTIKNYTPVKYNGTIIYQAPSNPSVTLNISPISEITVEGIKIKDHNISVISPINISIYEIKSTKKAKILWMIPVTIDIEVRIDADTGSVESIKKPWWSFLAG